MITAGTALVLLLLVGLLGVALGYLMRFIQMTVAKAQLEVNVRKTILKAREKAASIVDSAYDQTEELRNELDERTTKLQQQQESLDKLQTQLEKDAQQLKDRQKDLGELLEQYRSRLRTLAAEHSIDLKELRLELQREIDLQIDSYYQNKLNQTRIRTEEEITTLMINILPDIARRTVRNNTSVTINVSSDEIGKVIGRDGINIKSFERYAGVDLIIDDTANTVTISTFDPKRRLIAKTALVELLEDGRINREQIFDRVQKVEDRLDLEAKKLIKRGLSDLGLENHPTLQSPEVTENLLQLYFRHSYGQNQLEHAFETADIAGRIAAELLPNQITSAKISGLLHDIGKTSLETTDHIAGSLAILETLSVDDSDILTAIKEHHDDTVTTPLSAILQAADAISSGRPGARSQSSTTYFNRLEEIEKLIAEFDSVDNVYALSGGRELQILIKNKDYSQAKLQQLLTQIIQKIKRANLIHTPITIHLISENEIIKNVA